jgi:hypothetical protein
MAAIDLLVPLLLDLCGRPFEAGDRQRLFARIGRSSIGRSNSEIDRWR